jgi:type II secretory pathway component PulF
MKRLHLPGFDAIRKLSPEETADLAARVAELTKAGLPLGPGLRALAYELPGWRLPRMLHALADRLDAGADLVDALESQSQNLPLHLRGLIIAGVRSGRLAEVLEEFVDMQRSQAEVRRRVCLSLAYPFILLVFMAALAVVANLYIVRAFEKIFMDFGTRLPVVTQVTITMAGPVMWFSIALVVLATVIPLMLVAAPKASWLWPIVHRLPMLGPLLRLSHLTQYSRLMSILLDQQVPLPDALRLSASGSRDSGLARGSREVAEDVEKGRVLYESMAEHRQFPSSMIPVIQWGQLAPALPDAFRSVAEMFEGRTRSQRSILEAILLPIMCLAVITFVGALVIAMFLPLISLISSLSGG